MSARIELVIELPADARAVADVMLAFGKAFPDAAMKQIDDDTTRAVAHNNKKKGAR